MKDEEKGTLAVLNVGAGDLRVEFGKDDDANTKTIDMLEDMLKHGYAVLVEIDGKWERAIGIDRTKKEYILERWEPRQVQVNVETTAPLEGTTARVEKVTRPAGQKGRRGGRRARAPISDARAVGVARTAGGCNQRTPAQWIALVQENL